jgi:hypothetical protein
MGDSKLNAAKRLVENAVFLMNEAGISEEHGAIERTEEGPYRQALRKLNVRTGRQRAAELFTLHVAELAGKLRWKIEK